MPKASMFFTLSNVNGKHDTKAIKKELDALPGVMSVSVNGNTNSVAVDYDTTGVQSERIEKQLKNIGYEIIDCKSDNHIM
ncbi:MAG: heavy-metal-associated domain-containing protein [Ruminococcaceae bacterium]|nr:heavy-metal-associated domain-containing protein [Oscillospiraceae bacterium]